MRLSTSFMPNLVLVDFAVAGQNGAELAKSVRQRIGTVRILFVSGYADDEVLKAFGDATPILRKPFRPAELAAIVRSALDARPF